MKLLQNILISCLIFFIFFKNAISQSGWINQTIGTKKYVTINFINENTGFILSGDKTILKTTNTGHAWVSSIPDIITPPPAKNASFLNDSTYAISFTNQIYLTTNNGSTWNYNSIFPIGTGLVGLRNILLINVNTGYVCGYDFGILDQFTYLDGIIYKTTNSGVNWFQSFRGGEDYYDIKFKDSLTGYSNRFDIIKTTNGGNSWEYNGNIGDFTYSLSNIFNDTMYTCGDSGKVFRSINAGVDWTKFYTPAIDTLRKIYFIDSKTGYAIGNGGMIITTTSAGVNWSQQNSGTTRNLNSIWFVNKDTGFVVGDNGVVLKTFSGGILVNINNKNEFFPETYSLSQNYPNPFNPTTNLEFGISKLGFVSLKVYDLLGNEIKTLVNENKTAGSYEIEFDGSNLPSGVYYYKMIIGEFVQIRKMVLIK